MNFKTNIKTEESKSQLLKIFSCNKSIIECSIDCEDIDCVLRVVVLELSTEEIIELVIYNFSVKNIEKPAQLK